MSWARKRKFVYIGSITIIFLLVVVLPISLRFYKAPTCVDNKQNQGEYGIDCGGPCTRLCASQPAPLVVLWYRFFKVTDGIYNVMAYVENPNINAGADNLNYNFKLYDKNGLLLKERMGKTFASANKIIAIFEPELNTGNQIPDRLDFSFSSAPIWSKQESLENGLSVSNMEITKEDSSPRLSATITNKTINTVNNIEAVGIIYDSNGNTIAFSRTFIDTIGDHGSQEISFNWPRPFSSTYARTEIVLRILK
jgi:hypothetical protein